MWISPGDLLPQLSMQTQAFVRVGYGLVLLVTLLLAYRQRRRFFLSERWGGYGESCFHVNLIQNPVVIRILTVLWPLCALLLIVGWGTVAAALVNLLLCHYFFVQMRWKGVLRGLGAPGFMTYWLGAAVFLLEFTRHYVPACTSLALFVLQVDFALIMLSSGIYKSTSGYRQNVGMQYGMANPAWGYWWKLYRRVPPGHWLFRACNHGAWSVQLLAACLMLIPSTRFLGGLLIAASFAWVATQIRLGVLCHAVVLGGVLFSHPQSALDGAIAGFLPAQLIGAPPDATASPALAVLVSALLWSYLALLPFAHAGLYYNFYSRRPLPRLLQRLLDVMTNFFGIIIWRVFSADHTNFYAMIYRKQRRTPVRSLLSHYDRLGSRHNHVAECIVVTSIFTTLKYYPSNSRLFTERLLRYARTLPCPSDSTLVFEYFSIRGTIRGFEYVPVTEFVVDVLQGRVDEFPLDDAAYIRRPHSKSPAFEGVKPGSYVALGGANVRN